MAEVKLLTKEQAQFVVETGDMFDSHFEGIESIATGRAVVCPVRSEAEWRKRFEAWAEVDGGLPIVRVASGARYELWETEQALRAYIHAKREEGLVSGEQGGGNG